ncbi:MAG TPA: cytochrome P450 [Ktedonobacteraceae bacterium]|nr:cytochrome P450 [Ktedonobacteraceae bacterium]
MDPKETMVQQSTIANASSPPLLSEPDQQDRSSRFFAECYQKAGPVFRLSRPNKPPLTILVGPDANTFVARYEYEYFTTQEHWQEIYDNLKSGKVSRVRDGEANRTHRTRSSRYYSRARVLNFLPRMVEIAQEFTQWKPGESFVALASMQRVVVEQLGPLLVGRSPGDYFPDIIYYQDRLGASIGRSDSEDLLSPAYLEAQMRVSLLAYAILEKHKTSTSINGENDLVDDLLADARKYPEAYPDQILYSTTLTPFLAGLTTARTCCSMLYALLKHKQVYARVQAEVDAAFEQGPPTWERMKAMQDLQGAAMETLRLYPVANAHMCHVVKPCTFAGYLLEPGSDVLVPMTAPHFMAEFFPEPETFDIDRYRAPRNEHRHRGVYAPFGLGDHTCLGSGIAEVQLMAIIATILHTYQLELDPPDYKFESHQSLRLLEKNLSIKVIARRD